MSDYPVVTLCGSTKFKEEFLKVQKELTLKGWIVISVGLFEHSGDDEVWEGEPEDTYTDTKLMLDDLHLRKIDMADSIFVINKNGYIGESPSGDKYAMLIKNENNAVLYIFVYGIRRRLSPNFVMVHSDTSYDFKPLSKNR